MAEGIGRGVTGKRLSWNKRNAAWDKVFLTFHPDGDAPDNSSTWFHEDVWLDANGVEVWKEVEKVYKVMFDDYNLQNPVKPSIFLEGSYEFGSYRHECGWATPLIVRRQVYHTFFAGGAGHTYGAAPIWPMRGNAGDYSCGYTWKQALQFPGGANFAGVTKKFLSEYQWFDWVPTPSIIKRGSINQDLSFKAAVTLKSGKKSLVYFTNNSHAQIQNTLGAPAKAIWVDPRDGHEEPAGDFEVDEIRDLIPPGTKWEDAILVLETTN